MFEIPKSLYGNDTVHRTVYPDINNAIISCGRLHHKHHQSINENVSFKYYGAFLLLSGRGTYIDEFGNQTPIYPGCYVQRIPCQKHSTIVEEDGKWLEYFICFGYDTYCALKKIGLLSSQPILYPKLSAGLLQQFIDFHEELKKAPDDQLPFLLLEAQRIVFSIYKNHESSTNNITTQELMRKSKEMLWKKAVTNGDTHVVAENLGLGYENFRKQHL